MPVSYAALVGVLFAIAVYFFLRRDRLDHVFGLVVLTHAANLLVFGAGGLVHGRSPILGYGRALTDPLPQALVLTAIVIGFAITVYALSVVRAIRESEDQEPPEDRDA